MSEKDNGGAAFPVVHPDGMGVQYFGLSVRDYFAAKAMQAMVGSREYIDGAWHIHSITGQAYEMADAMLKERAK